MTYELARELGDAGFVLHVVNRTESSLLYRYPTLSELIEACGTDFEMLVYDSHPLAAPRHWRAHAAINMERGSTPEEAVARLWLALKKTS